MKKLIILLVLVVVGTTACQKEKTDNQQIITNQPSTDCTQATDSCGCGPSSLGLAENRHGIVRFRRAYIASDTIIHNQFWINGGGGNEGGGGVNTEFLICNCSNNLPDEIQKLKDLQDTITVVNVKYSGSLRKTCWTPGPNIGGPFAEIILTNIEVK